MADIAPFRGLRYNTEKVNDLAAVAIPPYDVISPEEQELFLRASPNNMVYLELGKTTPEDNETNNAHTRAKEYFREWQQERILIRDEQPAMYYYELDYEIGPGVRQVRYGFICTLRLEEFSTGLVRPHEKTFDAVKDERLGLMRACQTNLSPVFALYSDPAMVIDHALKLAREPAPVISFEDRVGMRHRVWRVVDSRTIQHVRSLMLDKPIFIADGHHRYETALNYRSIQRKQLGNSALEAPFDFIMMYLSNLDQGGLTILPTHRMLKNLDRWDPGEFLGKASAYFDVVGHDTTATGQLGWRKALENGRVDKETFIGLYWHGAGSFYLLKARPQAVSSYLAVQGVNEVLRGLDVVILDRLLLRHLLGLSDAVLGCEHNIHFKHDLLEAAAAVRAGNYEVGFFINPTRIEQVQDVASAGLIMPHKATYFYPKVWSGLLIHSLVAA
jgi:uncharacterized protein (DUF1015 family)